MSFRSRFAGAFGFALLLLSLPLLEGCQTICSSSSECGTSEYCAIPAGACLTAKSLGFCKPMPAACTDVLKPVCGCDGKNYDNSCVATRKGIAVAGEGACGSDCGGPSNAKCGSGEYCDLARGSCGQVNASGTCKPSPSPGECPAISRPVCGCDGKTYNNDCAAAQAQVSIVSSGACACGGADDPPCEDGRYCALPIGACLGANATGLCKPEPKACTVVKKPVCGCDGKTYINECVAAAAHISVATTDACEAEGDAGAGGNGM